MEMLIPLYHLCCICLIGNREENYITKSPLTSVPPSLGPDETVGREKELVVALEADPALRKENRLGVT